jgi:hypothetical protein
LWVTSTTERAAQGPGGSCFLGFFRYLTAGDDVTEIDSIVLVALSVAIDPTLSADTVNDWIIRLEEGRERWPGNGGDAEFADRRNFSLGSSPAGAEGTAAKP